METLNNTILEAFSKAPEACLEVTDIDVKRLRDDRSDIQLGDEVAFVATATFRLTQQGVKCLDGAGFEDLAAGDELLKIGADAELRSDKLSIDVDAFTRWLATRYAFTFLLNGAEHGPFTPVGRVRVAADESTASRAASAAVKSSPRPSELALPWIQKLNTAAVKADYIDVDVRIDEQLRLSVSEDSAALVWTLDSGPAATGSQPMELQIAAEARSIHKSFDVANLAKEVFRIRSDSGAVELRLTASPLHVVIHSPGDQPTPAQLPTKPLEAAKTTKSRH